MSFARDEIFVIPIVVVEETMRGWLAAIAKERLAHRQVSAYRELGSLFEFFATFQIAPFDQAAADLFDSLHAARFRIATRDLKIAAISRPVTPYCSQPTDGISTRCRD
jgi:tRNA(fMet)-specific endonuclease VapC